MVFDCMMFTCRPSSCPQHDPGFLPKKTELLMKLNTFIFQPIKSGYMWPSQTLDRFYTDNQSPSVQAPYKDFNTSHVIRSPFKCQPAYSHLFSVYKELFPASVCASACIMLRKSAFICTDSESGCGRQIFFPLHSLCGKTHMICQIQ